MAKARAAMRCKCLWFISMVFLGLSVMVEIILWALHGHGNALWFSDQMWRNLQAVYSLLFLLSLLVLVVINLRWMRSRAKAKKRSMPAYGRVACALTILGISYVVLTLLFPIPKGAIPSEIALHSADWPTANQNLSNTRSASGSSIDSANIGKLGVAWALPIKGVSEWGAAATNPLILGNKTYFQDLKSNIYAVDTKTGKQLWMKQYNLDNAGPNGVAIGYGKIFATRGHNDVVALDMNGNEKWSTTLSKSKNTGIDIQVSVFDNKVYASTVPGVSNSDFYKGGAYGVIYALDQETGKIIWDFNTVGSADIWGNPKVNSGGGAWYPPAFDKSTGRTFWGIGNAGPWPGTTEFPNGTSRPGTNLYTSSIVSLNAADGKLQWYNQVAPHDLFDYDFQISPILARIETGGVKKDIVIGAGKMGKVVAFDRGTGQTLWSTQVGMHKNDSLKELPAGVTDVAPSPLGGVETALAYAADGVVYAPYVDLAVQYTPTGFVAESFNMAAGKGGLTAIDAKNGKILWDVKLDSMNVGAATVVNDLVFTATYDGKIYAVKRSTGQKVWSYQAPGSINGWPAVSGDTILFPVGVGKTPQILAFRIGANNSPTPATTNTTPGSGKDFKQ